MSILPLLISMDPLDTYLRQQVGATMRSARGLLKHPFLVPGGIFHDQLWDWDSFWIVKAICGSWQEDSTKRRSTFLEHAVGSWNNFFDHQASNGTIPIMVTSTDGDVFGCTDENGLEKNQAKPIFGQFALTISEFTNDFTWMAERFDALIKFFDRWLSHYRAECGLLVWGSDVAIGVDNDPTTYGRPEFSSANIFLNCLFHRDVTAAAQIAEKLGRPTDAERLRNEAEQLSTAMCREFWDDIDGFFYTADVQCGDHRSKYLAGIEPGMSTSWKTLPLKIKMFTGFLPLWSGTATASQARVLVERHLRNEEEFWALWGIRSLAKHERMYDPATNSANPSNWVGPIWIVANYMIYEGLKRYGYNAEAAEIAGKIRFLLGDDLRRTGTLHECYHPDTACPNFNADFLSWNVLALLMH